MQIDTSMGTFTVELYYKHAPRTVKNFLELSKRGYYDGTKVRWGEGGSAVRFSAVCRPKHAHKISWPLQRVSLNSWQCSSTPIYQVAFHAHCTIAKAVLICRS